MVRCLYLVAGLRFKFGVAGTEAWFEGKRKAGSFVWGRPPYLLNEAWKEDHRRRFPARMRRWRRRNPRHRMKRRNPYPLCSCGTPFGWAETGKSRIGEHEITFWNYTPCPNCGRKPTRMFPPPHKLEKDIPWEEIPPTSSRPMSPHAFAKMMGAQEIQYQEGGTDRPYCLVCNKLVNGRECPEHPGDNIEYRPYSWRRRRWNPQGTNCPDCETETYSILDKSQGWAYHSKLYCPECEKFLYEINGSDPEDCVCCS